MKGFDEMEGVDVFRLEGFEKGELIDWYVANGYVLVDEVLSAAECDEIVADLKKINRGDYGCEPIAAVDWPAGADRLLGRYMYIGEPHAYSSVIRRYITHPGVCRVLDCVVGAYVPFWDGGYKCVQTMFVTKGPGGNGSPWHQDEQPIPTRDRSLTGVWIALADTTKDNGCLWILPESHKSGVIYERYPHDLPDVDSMPIARGFDDAGAVPVEMRKGSVLFFSGYLLHRSKKNDTASYRPALTMHYASAATWLSWKGERNYRGVIQVKGEDPYAGLGYAAPTPWAKEC